MNKPLMPFIGRQKELRQINKMIRKQGTKKVVCLQGAGGIGKTRFLEEIVAQRNNGNGRILEIVDFDDRALFLPDNLERHIAQNLHESAFEPYIHSLVDWLKMEAANVSPDTLEQQRQRVQQTFFDNYNQISAQQRIVVLFDTTDNLEKNDDVWQRLQDLLNKTQNSLFVLAGRNGDTLYETLKPTLGDDVELIILDALNEASGQEYLRKKQELLRINLDPELAQKTLILSQGKPILIDLAVEWLSRGQPHDWLTELTPAELEALPPQELSDRQEKFEVELVKHLIQIRSNIDRLCLLMSRVYPLDESMIAPLLYMEESEAADLFARAKTYVFVKSLPDGRISLHDEMRRMVNQYVWPIQDSSGNRRRAESMVVADYLQKEIERLSQEYAQVLANSADEDDTPIFELNTIIAREKFENDIWLLRSQQLHHTIYTDLVKGIQLFTQLFDEATQNYRLLFRKTLVVQVLEYKDAFNDEQKYRVHSRYIQYLSDRGRYDEAKTLVSELLTEDILPQYRIDLLIQLANLEVRLGYLERGVTCFDEAAQISDKQGFNDRLMLAINGRGWAHRNQGDFSQAIADYLIAYRLSLQLHNQRETARILNNMGFVNAYKGNRQAAMQNCNEALKLWGTLADQREIGITYSTLGEIHRRFAEWKDAFSFYNKALAIFEEEDMREWISTVRAGRAAIYLHRQELAKATADLEYAAENGPQNLRPRIIHTQAQVQMSLGNLTNSRNLFSICQDLSYKIGAYEYGFRSFADLLDLAWNFGEYGQWQTFLEQMEKLFAGHKGEEVYRLRGSSLRKIGDLAICDNAYEAALAAYQEGFSLIAKYEQYEPYQLSAQIKVTDERLHQCGKLEFVNRLGHDLSDYWQAQPQLLEKTPEALITFFAWQQEQSYEDKD